MDQVQSSLIGLVAGINGGIATVYVGQPLDTIKVKLQAFPESYSSALNCFRVTLAKDGIVRGLYAGTAPALAANIAENSVLFCALPLCQNLVRIGFSKHPSDNLSDFQHACAGSLAAFWSSLALCPTELVKCKVQSLREMTELGRGTMHPSQIGPWRVTKTILHEEGLRGFTRGLSATFAREIPGYFFFFGGYELCRSLIAGHHGRKEELGTVATAICGGVGGCMLWAAIFPFDLVKSRMQVGHIEATPTSTPTNRLSSGHTHDTKSSRNMFTLLFRIARNEGIGALYRGLGPTLLRTFPASGALFVTVEWTRKIGHSLLGHSTLC